MNSPDIYPHDIHVVPRFIIPQRNIVINSFTIEIKVIGMVVSKIYPHNIIEIYDLNEFLNYARYTPLFIYNPEVFSSPFLNENKIRSVTCHLIGVQFNNLSIILKYQKFWNPSDSSNPTMKNNPKDVIDAAMRLFIAKIENEFQAVKGNLQGEKSESIWDHFFNF